MQHNHTYKKITGVFYRRRQPVCSDNKGFSAIQANVLVGGSDAQDIVLLDVTPLSLGSAQIYTRFFQFAIATSKGARVLPIKIDAAIIPPAVL